MGKRKFPLRWSVAAISLAAGFYLLAVRRQNVGVKDFFHLSAFLLQFTGPARIRTENQEIMSLLL